MKTSVKKNTEFVFFSKGLVHDSGQKVEVYHLFCLSKTDWQKVFGQGRI